MRDSLIADPPREAVALSMFREGRNGNGIRYSAVTFPQNPWRGCERMIRMARAVGWISDSKAAHASAYAVLDVLDAQGDVIADYAIVDARAFASLKKKLGLVVETDGD
jgi:hypothetical protein